MEKRNAVYYQKYPQDVVRIRKILEHLDRHDVTLPNGGRLSPSRFLQLGMKFGMEGKLTVHNKGTSLMTLRHV